VTLNEWRLEHDGPWTRALNSRAIFPRRAKDNAWFDRREIAPTEDVSRADGLFVARAEAMPSAARPDDRQLVWTAGVRSWERLAERGFWVSGCQDGLGEDEPRALEHLAPGRTLTKLTHSDAALPADIATYALSPRDTGPDLTGVTHFYWMSGTSFDRARKLYPAEIEAGRHACGPGATLHHLRAARGLRHPIKVFVGLDQFLSETEPHGH
jgi:hydroxymethylbilane synthase